MKRVTRSKAEAQANYDRLSRWYDLIAASEEKYRDLGLQKLAVQPGERVLEIGFGTGHGLLALAEAAGEAGAVAGIDISPGMAAVAGQRLAQTGLTRRVDLCLGDAAWLPFAGRSFDAVFMSFTLELFDTPEIPVVLAACRRVLRESGRLGVVVLSRAKVGPAIRIYEWFHHLLPRLVDCRPIPAVQMVAEAGFDVVVSDQEQMWGLPVAIILAKNRDIH